MEFEAELVELRKFREAIAEAKLELSAKQQTDVALLPWLRARGYNVSNAVDMLSKSLEWRKMNNIDSILDWQPPPTYPEMFPYEISGRANNGCPLIINNGGRWNVRKVCEAGETQTWLRYSAQLFERLNMEIIAANEMRENGKPPICSAIAIPDFAGFSTRQLTSLATVKAYREAWKLMQSNYPLILSHIYYVNAPRAFSVFYGLFRSFLDTTWTKVSIFGSDQAKWKNALALEISKDQLPNALGGTKQPSIFSQESGTWTRRASEDLLSRDMIPTPVEAGGEIQFDYEITQPDTVIEWTLKASSPKITFTIEYEGSVLLNFETGKECLEKGASFKCNNTGTYILRFRNDDNEETIVQYMVDIQE